MLPLDDEEHGPRFGWEVLVGAAVVVGCVAVLLAILHPSQLLRDTTTNGGDMGAHVWWPDFLRDHWFGKLRLSGWAPAWYAGFPAGHFYFPLPAVLIAALDVLLPYNVAFKLVSVSGIVLLPVAAAWFAHLIRAPWPAPPAFAVAVSATLVQTRWTIYGGNIASTLAGEFSFTLGLALALLFLGTLARALREGRGLAWPALLLAGVVTSHIVVAVFAVVGALLVWIVHRPLGTWKPAALVGATAAALSSVWWLPMLARQHFTTNMRYEKVEVYRDHLFKFSWWMWVLLGAAIIAAGWWRRRVTLVLIVMAAVFGLLFRYWPEHHVWNTRFLPLYLLSVALIVALGAVEVLRVGGYLSLRVADWVREGDLADWRASLVPAGAPRVPGTEGAPDGDGGHVWSAGHDPAVLAEADLPEPPEHLRPGPVLERRRNLLFSGVVVAAVVVAATFSCWKLWDDRKFLPGWATWNYSGYESKNAYPEFREIMDTMGELPPGRALWEPSSDIDKYGTTLALELLPYYTDGRIGSMEGLYFESAATTPYHFLTVSELTAPGKASNPVRGLQYGTIEDFDRGVRHLRMLGVRYFMAQSEDAKDRADEHPDLRLVAEVPDSDGQPPSGWKIYEVDGSALVEGLANEPVVVSSRGGTQSECFGTPTPVPPANDPALTAWECAAAPWWMDDGVLDVPFAEHGPASWRRVDVSELDRVSVRRLDPVEVSGVREEPDRISFEVSRTGVPVVVRASYFPNWEVRGADGPYRLAPNLMVVVPTDEQVVLTYGLTGADWLGRIGFLLGVAGIVALALWRPGPLPPPRRRPEDRERAAGEVHDAPPDDFETDESERAPALP